MSVIFYLISLEFHAYSKVFSSDIFSLKDNATNLKNKKIRRFFFFFCFSPSEMSMVI